MSRPNRLVQSRLASSERQNEALEGKFKWLMKHLRCPVCQAADLSEVLDDVVCNQCDRRYPLRDGVIDFIDPDAVAAYELVETENVSDHPFDGNAMAIIDRCRETQGMVLDCGSGYKSIAFENVIQMEIARFPNVDILGVNQRIPFQEASFDAVFSLDVLEHVNDPFTSASEIVRVLKPGGILYFDMPFLQSEHGYPHHFFNSTRMGVRRLFEPLECLSHKVPASGEPIFTLHQLLSVYRAGLPEDVRGRFDTMTVEKLLSKSPLEWLDDAMVQELSGNVRWQIASTTQAIFRKPSVAGSPGATLAISPRDLPGFAS